MQAKKQEILFFTGALLLGIGLMIATFSDDFDAMKSTEKYSSTMYPRIIIGGWLLTAFISLCKAARRQGGQEPVAWGNVVPGVCLLLLFVAALKPFGFLIPAILFFFALALFLMASIRERLELAPVPKPLKGIPVAFIAAAGMALSFFGFTGIVS